VLQQIRESDPNERQHMTTEKRTSEQGNEFNVTIIRAFLLEALSHDAVTDAVEAMLFEHIVEGRLHPSVITENLRPLITEVLDTATLEDWKHVSDTLIGEARQVLVDDSVRSPSLRASKQAPDPGELREELGRFLRGGLFSPRKVLRAWKLVREIRRLTGISLESILADARADAEALRARDENDAARASRSSAQAPATTDLPEVDAATQIAMMQQKLRGLMDDGVFLRIEYAEGNEVEGWIDGLTETEVSVDPIGSREAVYDLPGSRGQAVEIPLAEIETVTELVSSVRPVMQEEALALLRMGSSSHPLPRKRAGIILASNFGCTIREIAVVQKTDEEFVRQVIAGFNERGLESLE
jgi:hypothetical protein